YRALGTAAPLRAFHRVVERLLENNIKHPLTTDLLVLLTGILLLFVIQVQIATGYLFNPRGYFHMNGLLRPFYNLMLALYPLSLVFIGLRVLTSRRVPPRRRLVDRAWLILLLMSMPFLGTRGGVLFPILTLLMFTAFLYYRRVRWIQVMGVGIGLVAMAIVLLGLRGGSISAVMGRISLEIFYGGTFSDTRDFAWVMSLWSEEWLWGKTYLAGLISFVPRQFSAFRDTWGLGVVTATTAHMHPATHPGLRPGTFGEAFLNFGVPGVVALGLLLGYVLAYVNDHIRRTIEHNGDVIRAYTYTLSWTLALCFSISIGFAAFYVLVLITLGLALTRQTLGALTRRILSHT
ncbi:MAG: O-antigen polymerase, partial [Catalinimonas sp.]